MPTRKRPDCPNCSHSEPEVLDAVVHIVKKDHITPVAGFFCKWCAFRWIYYEFARQQAT